MPGEGSAQRARLRMRLLAKAGLAQALLAAGLLAAASLRIALLSGLYLLLFLLLVRLPVGSRAAARTATAVSILAAAACLGHGIFQAVMGSQQPYGRRLPFGSRPAIAWQEIGFSRLDARPWAEALRVLLPDLGLLLLSLLLRRWLWGPGRARLPGVHPQRRLQVHPQELVAPSPTPSGHLDTAERRSPLNAEPVPLAVAAAAAAAATDGGNTAAAISNDPGQPPYHQVVPMMLPRPRSLATATPPTSPGPPPRRPMLQHQLTQRSHASNRAKSASVSASAVGASAAAAGVIGGSSASASAELLFWRAVRKLWRSPWPMTVALFLCCASVVSIFSGLYLLGFFAIVMTWAFQGPVLAATNTIRRAVSVVTALHLLGMYIYQFRTVSLAWHDHADLVGFYDYTNQRPHSDEPIALHTTLLPWPYWTFLVSLVVLYVVSVSANS